MQAKHNKYSVGLNALEEKGLKPIVEENLQITFNDPLGLYSDSCKLQHRCALQGKFDPRQQSFRNPTVPTLYIDGKDMGPLDNLKVQEIKNLAQPSPFGLGSKTVYDENVRKAFEIPSYRINLKMECPYEIQRMASMGHKIEAKLYKLAIYDKDGFFAEHADTLHADNHLGTLVMCLPVPHEGGTFILSDDENELRLPFDELIGDDQIPWVAFYTDVKHKVKVVRSGLRMTLQFDLFAKKSGSGLKSRLAPEYVRAKPESVYRFQDYNEEILSSIQDKLHKIFLKPKSQSIKKTAEEKDPKSSKKASKPERSGNDDFLQSDRRSLKKFKRDEEIEEKKEEKDEEKDEENIILSPDGVAIMLKRRYGAMSLSSEMLKGSDGALYHALKYQFRVEVKQIILEQDEGYEGQGKTPKEVVVLAEIQELPYTSDEEGEVGQDNMYIPKKQEESEEREDKPQEDSKEKMKNIYLVTGFSSKYLSRLANHGFDECTGNDALPAIYSYMHAALFVYPI